MGISETLMAVNLTKEDFENVVKNLREFFALNRRGKSTEVKATVNSMAEKFLQAADKAIHEATARLYQSGEIMQRATKSTTSCRTGSHSSLKSKRRKALTDTAAAKEQAEYEMMIASKVNIGNN